METKTKFTYELPKDLPEEIIKYREAISQFKAGQMEPAQFKAFRVSRGIYEQRQKGTFMCRVRIPAGKLLAVQMRKFAELSKKFGNGILHLTTRQDVQLHYLKLEDTPIIMEELLAVGLTSKGGGGNTVRNITACPYSGLCAEEIFDTSPYAVALTEYLIKDPHSYTLPRKYKIAFSGCSQDCALATVADLGFTAQKKIVDGKQIVGFRVYVAGGMGAYSRVADVLEEFVPESEFIYIAEAIKNLFDKYGNRKNRHKARLRFLMEKWGLEEFKKIYQQELDNLKKSEKIANPPFIPLFQRGTQGDSTFVKGGKTSPLIPPFPKGGEGGFSNEVNQWFNINVAPQKQAGYYLVKVRIPLGLIAAEQSVKLAGIAEEFTQGRIQTTQDQNFLLSWIRKDQLGKLYPVLESIGLADYVGGEAADPICCPGADTCQLGICLSRGLARQVVQELKKIPDLEKNPEIKIRISGCPNSCGQHPIGAIGLYGAARRVGNHLAPFYHILLGGRTEEGKTALGENIGSVPAKNLPALLGRFFTIFLKEKKEKETGIGIMQGLVKDYAPIPCYEGNEDYYRDWGSNQEFSLAGRGPGECGAGVLDIIELDLKNAQDYLGQADSSSLYQAAASACRALLVTQGLEAKSDIQAFEFFDDKFIRSGLVADKFQRLLIICEEYGRGNIPTLEKYYLEIKELIETVANLYDSMDDSFKFSLPEKKVVKEEKINFMDLKGVPCPLNYVKAKLVLETMAEGEILELILDEGEPISNVPSSLEKDGQQILKIEQIDGQHYRVMVRKKM